MEELDGDGTSASDLFGGRGAYAGIHVPKYEEETLIHTYKIDADGKYLIDSETNDRIIESTKRFISGQAILNLSGSGTIKCFGGDASDGCNSTYSDFDMGGSGGGGAGAGIGGNRR